jgi:NTP pyrophosphatase (non-canonical NTP hydrolase)
MTEEQYLLLVLAEECAEIAKVASKAIRFGLEHVHDGTTNKQKLFEEFADLIAAYTKIEKVFNHPDQELRFRLMMAAKDEKLGKMMEYSRSLGKLA